MNIKINTSLLSPSNSSQKVESISKANSNIKPVSHDATPPLTKAPQSKLFQNMFDRQVQDTFEPFDKNQKGLEKDLLYKNSKKYYCGDLENDADSLILDSDPSELSASKNSSINFFYMTLIKYTLNFF